MSAFAQAAPKYPLLSDELLELIVRLFDARDDEDEKRKVEAFLLPFLTSESVNSVYDDGTPTLGQRRRVL